MLAARMLAVMGGGDRGDAEMNEATRVARKQAAREGVRSNGGVGEVEAARLVVQVMMARLVVTKAALTEEAREAVVQAMRAILTEKRVAVPVVKATEEVTLTAAIQEKAVMEKAGREESLHRGWCSEVP